MDKKTYLSREEFVCRVCWDDDVYSGTLCLFQLLDGSWKLTYKHPYEGTVLSGSMTSRDGHFWHAGEYKYGLNTGRTAEVKMWCYGEARLLRGLFNENREGRIEIEFCP